MGELPSRLRQARLAAGFSTAELARLAGISRQALAALEVGKAIPRVDTALRLARLLGTTVEQLFTAAPSSPPGIPLRAVHVAGHEVVYPLKGADACLDTLPVPDRLVAPTGAEWTPGQQRDVDLVLAGCDPFAGWLAARVESRHPRVRVVLRSLGSVHALAALARGEVHAAGVHMGDEQANAELCRRVLGTRPHLLVGWLAWEGGIAWSRATRRSLRSVSTVVAREEGSAARALLEDALRSQGIDPHRALSGQPVARGHVAVAQLLSLMPNAGGITCGPVAALHELPFTPLRVERYELCILADAYSSAPVRALLDTLGAGDWQPLSALGMDVDAAGQVREGLR